MDCGPPGSSVQGILQARTLKWVAISFSRGFSQPRNQPGSPALQADSLPTEPLGKPIVGEGPGETPLAVRYLSYLISSFLTEIKRLAKN